MPDVIFNGFLQYHLQYGLNLPIKCALFKSTLTLNRDTQDVYADISAEECSGTNYTAGGKTVTGKAFTHNDTLDEGTFDLDDVLWTSLTVTDARFAIFYYCDPGQPWDGKLISAHDFGANKNPVNTDFKVKINDAGLLSWKQAA
jgi:hypothetical protein